MAIQSHCGTLDVTTNVMEKEPAEESPCGSPQANGGNTAHPPPRLSVAEGHLLGASVHSV